MKVENIALNYVTLMKIFDLLSRPNRVRNPRTKKAAEQNYKTKRDEWVLNPSAK
jgi:hypothetical protein